MAGIKKSFRFRNKKLEYDIKLRKKFPLWIFLLFLPLVLLVRCQKELTVRCIDSETGSPIPYQDVTLSYVDRFIVSEGRWFSSDSIRQTRQTDSLGVVVFKELPCSVFSYLCFGFQQGKLSANNECYEPVDRAFNFHYTCHIVLRMDPRREDLRVLVVDADTGDPLPDAIVHFSFFDQGRPVRDSARVDAAGVATLPGMRYCATIETLTGQCFGYYPDTRKDIQCRQLLSLSKQESATLRLPPIKEQVSFYVKNAISKEPIPDARCNVMLTLPGSTQKTISREVRTSIDGRGIAVYADAPIVSTITIHASKVNYKDSTLTDSPRGPWRVVDFIQQDNDIRTIWLEPVPYLQEFVIIDSLSRRPVPGVRNEITVTRPDGTTSTFTEMSNRNGVFPVLAAEDDMIDVVSSKGSEYKIKKTKYPKFKDISDRQIILQPVMIDLEFQTVTEDAPTTLLPDCSLQITGSISGQLLPQNSGNGSFVVTMRKEETLSIVSSKSGFKTNSTKVHNADAVYLNAYPDRRVIPMERDLLPCNGNIQSSYQGPSKTIKSFSMGQMSGNASIWVDFYGIGDYLTVYDGPSVAGTPIIKRTYIEKQLTLPLYFTKGSVTVVIESGIDSSGEFVVRCPTQ